MEQLQEGYVRAVAAAAGCVVSKPEIDEGIDLVLTHKSQAHWLTDKKARLEVQLKATSQQDALANGSIRAEIDGHRFNELAVANPTVHKIVVVMLIPQLQEHWTYARAKGLTIHRCAYWVNLADLPPVTAKTTTVAAPTSQVFDDVTLCGIMQRIGSGGQP